MGDNGHNQIYVGRKAICQALGITWKTVVKWIDRRELPVLQEPGFPPSLHQDELRQWHKDRHDK